MRSATGVPVNAAEARAEAVGRVRARTRPNKPFEPGSAVAGGSEFEPARSLDEAIDDVLARMVLRGDAGDVLAVILTAARGGARHAATAAAAAGRLGPWDQVLVFTAVAQLSTTGLQGATDVAAAVKDEWLRLKLADGQIRKPQVPPNVEENRPKFASEGPGDRYSPSVPDHMKVRQ